ncbi:hypothetical protein FDP41_008014 [Naegleria fowleri]|uniref:Uncharacterized protein n=1 Tax=Naegleria fowleri TaxID=5763 RepID=A0A6A5CFM5_NAEFO|nr:uncharacterized protein FDP41_008014 [Naegleria fowleri]KAF0984099.1 hypothetical protein FDP41_008014 [Naegleria fowleri]CAG4708099.1 unnamed protein product [Naegleria fowleri]
MSSSLPIGQTYTICRSRSSNFRKKALIIHGDEPDHFFSCACEKFAGFVRDPQVFVWPPKNFTFQPDRPDDSFAFLSGVDLIHQLDLIDPQAHSAEYLRTQYSLIVFPLYAGSGTMTGEQAKRFSEVISMIKKLIIQKQITVLFLRGSANSVPSRLGYMSDEGSQDGFVGYTLESTLELNMNELNELAVRSRVLTEFLNSKLLSECSTIRMDEQLNKIVTIQNASFLCGIPRGHLKDRSSWHLLISSSSELKDCLLIHKEHRVFFTPWYGMPTNENMSHHIVKYFCKFMVEEYFVKNGGADFQVKMKSKYQNQQLIDIVVVNM